MSGSGAAGVAVAFFLKRFSTQDMTYDVTIVEKEAVSGRRVKSVNVPEYELGPLEVRASTFSKRDIVLDDIIGSVGLKHDLIPAHAPTKSAIRSDREIVARLPTQVSTWRDWVHMIKLYGLSFAPSKYLSKDTLSKLRRLSEAIQIHHIYQRVKQLGAENSLWWTPAAYLRSKWISGKFLDEYATASVRAYFGQTILETSAYYLALSIGFQLEEQLTLRGGNDQQVERMILHSQASVHYSQKVTGITKVANGSVLVKSSSLLGDNDESKKTVFDSAIVAAPWTSTSISMPDLTIPPSSVRYIGMCVTHFMNQLDLKPETFNLSDGDSLPNDIMTTPLQSQKAASDTNNLFDFFRLTKIRHHLHPPLAGNVTSQAILYRLLTPEPPRTSDLVALLRPSKDALSY